VNEESALPPVEELDPAEEVNVFTVLGGNIVASELKANDVRSSGIVLPTTARERPRMAIVLAVGKGQVSQTGIRFPIEVGKGDIVLFAPYSGTSTEVEEQDVIILRQDEILGAFSRGKQSDVVQLDSYEIVPVERPLDLDERAALAEPTVGGRDVAEYAEAVAAADAEIGPAPTVE